MTELAPSPSHGERPAPRRRHRPSRLGWIALLLIATALLIRLAYVEATPGYQLVHDARDYDTHARSIAAGEGYSKHLLYDRPTAFRPPGYPYFLGGVYRLAGVERAEAARRIRAARIAQALVGTAAVALLGLLAAQLWGPRVALLVLALGAVYVPLILVGGAVMSEPLFVVLMLAALAAAVHHRGSVHRYRFAILAGVLGGLAILTRANALVLLGPLAFAAWDARPRLSRRALGPPIALVVAALLTVAPWTARNAIVLDSFIPVSTQLGSALAGTYNDAARTDRENPASWRSLKRVPDYAHLMRQARETPEPVLERRLREASLDYIAEHPFYVFKVGWWSTLRMLDLAGRDWSRHTASTISVDRDWADAGVICFWIFALLALAGALTGRARRAPAFLWVVPALMFLSVVFLVVETPRYRSAIDPFVVLLAGLALTGGLALRGPHARGNGETSDRLAGRRARPRENGQSGHAVVSGAFDEQRERALQDDRASGAAAASRRRWYGSCSSFSPAAPWPRQPASSRTTVSTRSTSARVVRKFVMQARRAKRPSTVAFDR